jgi:hypothetical protein
MTNDKSLPVTFIDVGSTIIKIHRHQGAEKDRKFEPRNYEVKVGEQVESLIAKIVGKEPGSQMRICSSANGGLRVGILSLTARYSGETAKRIALASGCNVMWMKAGPAAAISEEKVDAIVIAGGLDIDDCSRQEKWISEIAHCLPESTPVIFSGNKTISAILSQKRKDAIILDNILLDDMRIQQDALSGTLKELYMQDLVQKDGISMLQKYSEIPIWPTPAICERAFRNIMEYRTSLKLAAPLLMMDIGGATTDIYYGKELIENLSELNVEALSVNRFVFSSIGVKTSQESTLLKLAGFNRLFDLISCFSPEDAQKNYASFRDNDISWIGETEMFYFCFGLVLAEMQSGKESDHPIALSKVSTLIITGGASKICDPAVLETIYRLFLIRNDYLSPTIHIDSEYEIWTYGIGSI